MALSNIYKLITRTTASIASVLVLIAGSYGEAGESTAVFVSDVVPPQTESAPVKSARAAVSFVVQDKRAAKVDKPKVARTNAPRSIMKTNLAPERAEISILSRPQPQPTIAQRKPNPVSTPIAVASPKNPRPEKPTYIPQQATQTIVHEAAPIPTIEPQTVQPVRKAVAKVSEAPKLAQPKKVSKPARPTIRPFERVINQQVRQVSHQAPVSKKEQQADPVSAKLIKAHKLSQTASRESQYSAIANLCNEAIQEGAKSDKKDFARRLSSWALNRRGQLHADAGQHIAANADFQASIDFNSENWRAIHNRGVSRAQTGQFADAFDDFNLVIELNPKFAKAYSNRATLYVQAKDMSSALEDYRRSSQLNPKLIAAHMGQGRVCHMLGKLDQAIHHFSNAVQVDPTNADVLCSRGDLLADMGRYADAMADYARTIEIDPEYGHAYRNGAWLLATCPKKEYRDPENAIAGAKRALEIGYGDRHVALDTLAAALASSGDYQKAVSTIKEAIELAPQEAKFAYLTRMQMYQDDQPYLTEPVGDIAKASFEIRD